MDTTTSFTISHTTILG